MSTQSLANKYRPRTFGDMVGQRHIAIALSNSIKTGNIKQSLLFSGLRGSGKTSAARILAKSLNCLNSTEPTIEPCGECSSCQSIDSQNDFSVQEFDVAADPSVDSIRDLIRDVSIHAPGRYKVEILDECHQWSKQAQNAFLRCLEAPPSNVVFVLCTTDPQKLLDTIRSRCLEFGFKKIGKMDVLERLSHIALSEQIDIDEAGLRSIVNLTGGSMRDAISLLDRASLAGEKITYESISAISGKIPEADIFTLIGLAAHQDYAGLLTKGSELIANGAEPDELLTGLLGTIADLLKVQAAPQILELTRIIDSEKALHLASELNTGKLTRMLQVLRTSELQIQNSGNAEIWLEITLLRLAEA